MRMNMEALKALELKLAEYNGAIAEYASSNMNRICYNCNSLVLVLARCFATMVTVTAHDGLEVVMLLN